MILSRKTLIPFLLLLAIAVVSLGAVWSNEQHHLKVLFEDRQAERRLFFDKVWELQGESAATFAKDYTYWDDMVEFVKTGDRQWAIENLETGLSTFKVDAIWVYNPDGKLVYSVISKGEELVYDQEIDLPARKNPELFAKEKLIHFYITTKEGVFDVRGATIHPTDDPERKTAPAGYFFTGCFLDKNFADDFSKVINGQISALSANRVSSSADKDNLSSGSFTFYRELKGFDGNPAAYVQVENTLPTIRQLARNSFRDLGVLAAVFLAGLGALYWIVYLIGRTGQQAAKLAGEMTKRLRESESRYRSYIELTGQLAWSTDANGNVTEDIPTWREFTGQSYDDVRGFGWSKALHPDDAERTLQVWKNAVATKSSYEVEYRVRRYDGEYRWFLALGVPVEGKNATIREWVGTCIDITERKSVEEENAKHTQELERHNKIMVDRELKMVELKKEIEKLKKK